MLFILCLLLLSYICRQFIQNATLSSSLDIRFVIFSKMRDASTFHDQAHDAQEPFAKNKPLATVSKTIIIHTWSQLQVTYRSKYNQRRVLPPHRRPPPPRQQSADGTRQRERRDVVHANGDGDAARDQGVPALAGRLGPHGGGEGEQDGRPDGPLLGHGWEALAGDQAGGENPDVAGGDLKEVTWYLVDADRG